MSNTQARIHHAVPSSLLKEPGTGFFVDGRLQSALFISAAAHIFLILAVGFAVPKIINSGIVNNTLDVVIVNQSNNIKSEDATVAAQSDNSGGGTSELDASTPLPWKAVTPNDVEQLAINASSDKEVEEVTEELFVSFGRSEIIQRDEETPTDKKEEQRKDKIKSIQQIRLEKKRLAAKYNKERSDFQKRPKREYLSPDTARSESAAYLVALVEKIERIGSLNFPSEIRNKKLSGSLIADLALNRNGTINSIKVLKSSGNPLLDKTAIDFIRTASPYKPFSDSMLKADTNIIHITRTYIFTPNTIRSEATQQK